MQDQSSELNRWQRYKRSARGKEMAAKRLKERWENDPEFVARRLAAGKRYREKHPEKMKAKNKRGNASHSMSIRESNLRNLYGITSVQYQQMHDQQAGLCAICQKPEPGGKKRFLSVDHDHSTGAIRQLLCDPCNNGLGRFNDSEELLLRALEYIRKHKVEP